MQVLIADDDPVYLDLMEDLLVRWGHDVAALRNGAEAWEVLQDDNAPRLVLLDWIMPGLDGFELCRKIRQHSRASDETYVILVTGSGRERDVVQVLVAGADDYLLKPFGPSDLQVRLRAGIRILELRAEVADLTRRLQAPCAHRQETAG